MDYGMERSDISDRLFTADSKEKEFTGILIAVVLVVIGVMYVYDQAYAQKQAPNREQEAKQFYWQWSYVPPAECQGNMAWEDRYACTAHRDKAWAEFEAEWNRKLASGWVPPKLQVSQAGGLQN